ncbi:hypothetical protein [Agrobacterium rosae]|uniref:Uncharacterized protein n=1 Tax=Agrobacterium rosae TaxID=1972867 RepID=A0AAW9FLV8_9HYPH|nr:hypothetical protein [Agrobacterium rosae]MDX8303843.1 hypothetical protein [Agrobacterium rosae]
MFATAIRVAAALAENGSILPPLDYRRGSKSKADVAELAGRASSNGVRHPDGKGRTLTMSDRFSGKVSPFRRPGSASRGKWIVVWPKELNGAL